MIVSGGISVSYYVLSENEYFLKMLVSEIRVKRILVNQGLGVYFYTICGSMGTLFMDGP